MLVDAQKSLFLRDGESELKTRRFVGYRDQDSRFKYNSYYSDFFDLVFAGPSWFCEKMGKQRVVSCIFFFLMF